ncbi:MAG: hypothetical protein K0R77_2096 [Chryseobacterium sp.]|jgi:hypothetical protein|uniref:beta strand repeat-containing protein n=1 Tax=Chryseobacterium sp. TaxID=1871047 RepID=UPI00261209C8|nr:hypothetical protein [Chryseobacterium sp.]MDF2552821.1 hypothetical protein [Chryseobacterium sp.]
MKKNIILLGALIMSSLVYSQVGINNEAPKATLDVTAKTTDGTKPEGIIAPRLAGSEIQSGDAQYLTAQTGTIVYATSASPDAGTAGKKTINIDGAGYYYFDGILWVKFSGTGAAGPNDWHITGNSGTTPIATVPTTVGTTNYVGTSDAQNFVVGVNGVSRGIFTQQGSFIGGAGTMDVGALPEHVLGTGITPTGSFIWGGGHRLAIATDGTPTGNANYATVLGNRNTVQSSNGFTTGTQNTIGTSSVSSMVSGTLNNIGNFFQTSIVSGQSNTMTHSQNGGRGNIVVGTLNSLSGLAAPVGAIVGGASNTSTTTSNHFLMMGTLNTVNASNTLVAGTGNTITTTMPNAAVVGTYNTPVDNSLFTVGNGIAATSQSNAMVVLNNGNVGIGANNNSPSNTLHVKATADPLKLEGLTAGAAADDVLVATSTGVVKKVPASSFGGSGAATEPWFVQGTASTQATSNTQHIYQTGRVAINKTTTTKQLDVAGDFRTEYGTGTRFNVIDNNPSAGGNGVTMFEGDTNSRPTATELNFVELSQPLGSRLGSKSGGAYGNVHTYAASSVFGTAKLEAGSTSGEYNHIEVTSSNAGSNFISIVSQASKTPGNLESTNINLKHQNGVNFFYTDSSGSTQTGNYTFPRVNGSANQVLTTDGASGAATLSWTNVAPAVSNNLTGSGNAYACINPAGQIYRSATPCTP